MKETRLRFRKLKIWGLDYLHYRYLWPNIERAVGLARQLTSSRRPIVLDLGCGQKPYADLFEGCFYLGMNYSTSDAIPDVVADATNIPVATGVADIVFCTQVIEHVSDPQTMVRECFRVLKPGGFLILTGPFYWPLHEEPYDFHRFTKYGFANLLANAGFTQWEIRPDGGDFAQVFLSMNLLFRRRFFAPIRVLLNVMGMVLDKIFHRTTCPANYTVFAKA